MITDTVTLGALVDRTLMGLQAPNELGRRIVLQDTLTTSTTTFNVDDATLFQVTNILEFPTTTGAELMYVTAKSDALATADVTVVRGYAGTTATAHTSGDVGAINPPWSRQEVADQIVAAFPYMEGNRLPLIVTTTELAADRDIVDNCTWIIDVPAAAQQVHLVRAGLRDLEGGGWTFIDNLPAVYSTGKVVALPPYSRAYQSGSPQNEVFSIVYSSAYTWSVDPPVETSTITIGKGTDEVPVKYAIWQLTEARERRRIKLDRGSEFAEGVGFDTGPQHVRLARETFISTLDVARRRHPPPRTRPFVSYPSYGGF